MKLLLTSGGLTNFAISQALKELANGSLEEKNLAFIPTAATVGSGDKRWLIRDLVNCRKYGFKEIDIEKLSFDGEKGMVEERIIYQRISDGKYFDAIVYRGSAGNVWFDDLKMTEVFKKTVKKTMYE
jgi:hypothetical protein